MQAVDPFDDHDSTVQSERAASTPDVTSENDPNTAPGATEAPHAAVAQSFEDGGLHDAEPSAVRAEEPSDGDRGDVRPAGDAQSAMLEDPSELRRKWESVQVRFVDDPRSAVREADALVTSTMEQLTNAFDEQRSRLASCWDNEAETSTDDLRGAFQTYRDFFNRLLSV